MPTWWTTRKNWGTIPDWRRLKRQLNAMPRSGIRSWTCKQHYWENQQNLNEFCRLNGNIQSMLISWFWKLYFGYVGEYSCIPIILIITSKTFDIIQLSSLNSEYSLHILGTKMLCSLLAQGFHPFFPPIPGNFPITISPFSCPPSFTHSTNIYYKFTMHQTQF